MLARAELENKGLITDRTNAVYDYEFIKVLKNIPWSSWLDQPKAFRYREQYLSYYDQWIRASKLNKITGLERFVEHHLINGTTQVFDELYFKYKEKRLRIFRGEYAYHRRVASKWAFIEDAALGPDDYIVISAPFCSTGDLHHETYPTLDQAYDLKIPVIIDCAYYGTCQGFELDVSHPAIESVSFSLTKGTGLGDIRSGIRYSNIKDTLPICQHNEYDHTVLAAARIGLYMMEHFKADHIPSKFAKAQKEVCNELGINPSKCMHLALGDENWEQYKVDKKYNRIGIRELVKARYKGLL